MNFLVQHKNGLGVQNLLNLFVSLPAFLKHASLAGQGPSSLFPTFSRAVCLVVFYEQYILCGPMLNFQGFAVPMFCDPAEMGDFSTIADKGFADFLAKNILLAPFTLTYEAVLSILGQPVTGQRPDFLGIYPRESSLWRPKAGKTPHNPAWS